MRRDIDYNSHKYLSNTPGDVQASAFQLPDCHWKKSLAFILQVGWCVSLHPLGGAKLKTTCIAPRPCFHYLCSLSFLLATSISRLS